MAPDRSPDVAKKAWRKLGPGAYKSGGGEGAAGRKERGRQSPPGGAVGWVGWWCKVGGVMV